MSTVDNSSIKSNNARHMCVVMSGGLLPDGSLPKYVQDRCDYVLRQQDQFDFVVVSSSFSLNVKPKMSLDGGLLSEASVGFRYLKNNGCTKKVFCEQFSHDTVGSVFFCLDLFANVYDVKKITFITSDFHKDRVQVVADFLNQNLFENRFIVMVIGCASAGVTQERVEREATSINRFLQEYALIVKKKDFLAHFLENHKNYNHEYGGSNLDGRNLGY